MKTFFSVFLITLLGFATLASASVDSNVADVPTTGDAAILKTSQAIRESHLVNHPGDCYSYKIVSQTKKYYEVEVNEFHNHRECPGDPDSFPHLFSVRISRLNGKISTDAKSTAGKFTSL